MQLRDEKEGIYCPGHWSLPGGRKESAETELAAAKRELYEETGYIAADLLPFDLETYRNANDVVTVRATFLTMYDGRQSISCSEGQRMSFVPFCFLHDQRVVPGHLELISKALRLRSS